MTSSISAMAQLRIDVPAPEEPVENGPLPQLHTTEKSLGLILPSSFVELARAYGTGSFRTPEWSGLLQFFNPFSSSFVQRVTELAQAVRELKRAEGDSFISHEIYPEKPGLLPFGYGEGERLLFWLTDGPPDSWPVVVSPADRSFHQFALSVPDFLVKLFAGDIDCWGAEHDSTWFKKHGSEITFRPAKRRA